MDDIKILIVEDETINALLVKALVKQIGYSLAMVANNGEDAIKKAIESRPDIILMDIMLGKDDMDGIEASKIIKKHMDVPIVYLTAHSDKEILNKAISTNPYDYLLKPVNEESLKVSIEMSLYKFKIDRENKRLMEKLKEIQFQLMNKEKLASVGQLAAGMAHEINNPLGFIRSNTETLRKYLNRYKKISDKCIQYENDFLINKTVDTQENIKKFEEQEDLFDDIDFINNDVEELLDEMNEGFERIQAIVSNLREFSRVDSLDQLENHNLNNNVRTTIDIARNEINDSITIRANLGQLPMIQSCSRSINQLLLEMIRNAAYAIKANYSDESGEIRVRTYCDEVFVCCEIEDNGIGIVKEDLTSVFNPFFTTKDVSEGKGLGLSIAHHIIVNRHKGSINVESNIGTGTKFIIKLPIKQN